MIVGIVLLTFLCIDTVGAQEAVNLERALKDSTVYFTERLPKGSMVVILNFQSDYIALTDYIIDELTMHLVNDGNLTVVDRHNLEMLRQEMNFQLSGEVSDASAQSIGQKLGAQTIISGAITPMGEVYRLRIRAIAVETAAIQGMQNINIMMDNSLAALTGSSQRKATGNITPDGSSPRKTAKIRNNWISGEINMVGGGLSYERMLHSKWALGANFYYQYFGFVYNDLGIDVHARLYPSGRVFYLSVGIGYHGYESEYYYDSYGGYTSTYDYVFAINPGLGWKIDVGKPGGFFMDIGFKVPQLIGGHMRYTLNFVPHIGFGGAF
ncbi:MAG: hypothetical protein FWC24_01100 [Treponema sp.]|nr:hypothetical protein [Treponema sp.]